MKDTAIVWFRNDLRVHDNEALTKAIKHSDSVLPVYVFDERVFFGKTKFGFPKTDIYRAQFAIESVTALRNKLKQIGLDLIVRVGKPEEIIFDLARSLKSSWVYANRERTSEEIAVQDALEKNLWTIGQELIFTRGKMLFYTSDLPFPITHTPDIFTQFRKEVEKFIQVRKPLPIPDLVYCKLAEIDQETGAIPKVGDFGHNEERLATRDQSLIGGEEAGKKQLNYYLWETDLISNYKATRNELLGWDFSSKFSSYLSFGCLSPKMIYHEVSRYEQERNSNDSTYWMKFELFWRDFFRLMGKKHGNQIFLKEGPMQVKKDLKDDTTLFNIWKEGRTGIPFIDANMIQLNRTGFMSNRGRQNVASFLVHDLKVNWLMGAEYFESLLIDYDPCSNYGNWNYISGVGSDPRENRHFNIISQAHKYDHEGLFVKHWIPALSKLPQSHVQEPYLLTEEEQEELNVVIGKDYPKAILTFNA